MFRTIRDHQSSSVKVKADKKKKNGTWGYSSSKRHVKAKVMELPFAEDLDTLAKRVGINDLNEVEFLTNDKDEGVERVFVRIDDFINLEISQMLQRSYSVDYLNEFIGPRTRISDVKIPPASSNSAMKSQSMLSIEAYAATHQKKQQRKQSNARPAHVDDNVDSIATDFRIAPYDLRYWSILKLLEEERKSEDGVVTYFEEPNARKDLLDSWPMPAQIIKEALCKWFVY